MAKILATSPSLSTLSTTASAATPTIAAIGVPVRSLTVASPPEPGSIWSRDRAKTMRVATAMLAIRQAKIEANATTTIRSLANGPIWTSISRNTGLPGPSRNVPTEPGMAMPSSAKMTRPAAPDTATERSIARGAARRGSFVSSARSAAPSQPRRTYTGSSPASATVVNVMLPPPT